MCDWSSDVGDSERSADAAGCERKKFSWAPFFSGDARWTTVGTHVATMGITGKAIAPKCAPWVRARMFEKLAAKAVPAKAQAAPGCTAAEARRPGQSMKPTATAARIQQ